MQSTLFWAGFIDRLTDRGMTSREVTPTMAMTNSQKHIPTAHRVDQLDTHDGHYGIYYISDDSEGDTGWRSFGVRKICCYERKKVYELDNGPVEDASGDEEILEWLWHGGYKYFLCIIEWEDLLFRNKLMDIQEAKKEISM